MNSKQFQDKIGSTAFAFRGYNVTNLGRSHELLMHDRFGPIVRAQLREVSQICSDLLGRRMDLIGRVQHQKETTLRSYKDAVALILAMQMAQLRVLEEFFEVDFHSAKLAYGYSLGEIAALVAGGVLPLDEALKIPLMLADECVALSRDVTLAVIVSRARELAVNEVKLLCLKINAEGKGVIDIQSYLAPNSMLLMGQGDTLDRFKQRAREELSVPIHLRKNDNRWPPIHTSIVWEKNISNRVAYRMHTMKDGFTEPTPPVFSMITGTIAYNQYNVRDLLARWVDSPQRLWDAVYHTLKSDIATVVHVGPEPNIIPATFKRLKENVETQTKSRPGLRALSIARPWLQAILPARTALLRAPQVEQVILEDWLLTADD